MKTVAIASLSLLPCLVHAGEPAWAGKEISCSYSHKSPLSSGEAKLGLSGGKLGRLRFSTYYPGGVGMLGFTCYIDWRRGDGEYAWQDDPLGAVITVKTTGDTVLVRQDKQKKGYRLDFSNLNKLSKWCGAGADVPDDVFIPLSGKACKVTMPK